MDDRHRPELPAEKVERLWRLMQRIEYCRYRAELADQLASQCAGANRLELAEVAQHWRDLAHEIELIDRLSGDPAMANSQTQKNAED
jgi:hypothetical protein